MAKWQQNLSHFTTMDRRPGLLTNWNVQKKISDAFRSYRSYRNPEKNPVKSNSNFFKESV